MKSSHYGLLSRLFSIALLLSLPWAIYQATQTRIGSASADQWLPANSAERQTYDRFLTAFGNDLSLVISWPGCRLDDPRLDDYLSQLRLRFDARTDSGVQFVVGTNEMLASLTNPPLQLSNEEATRRLLRSTIGVDGTCAVIIGFLREGIAERERVMTDIDEAADSVDNLGRKQLLLGGELYQMLEVDRSSEHDLRKFLLPSSFAALAVAWCCLRSIRLMALVFILAGVAQLFSVVVIHATGGQLSAVLIVLPTMVFMLTLSGSVHLVNYYLESGGEANPLAAERAVWIGTIPCLLATLTTVFGFGSLLISHLSPVRQFGGYSVVGLLLATTILLLMFPPLIRLLLFMPRFLSSESPRTDSWGHRGSRLLGRFLGKRPNLIAGAGVGLLILFSLMLPSLESSTEFLQMFPAESRSVRNLHWLEEHLCPLNEIEVLIAFEDQDAVDLLEQAIVVDEFHGSLESLPGVSSVVSSHTFLPRLPTGRGIRDTFRRAAFRKQLINNLQPLIDHQVIAEDGQRRWWRITVRVYSTGGGKSFSEHQAAVEQRLKETAEAHRASSATPFTTAVTGITLMLNQANRLLLHDLGSSFMMAFLLITPVMMLIVRSVGAGLLLMIPNVLPVVLVFGGMAFLRVKLDIASVLTASVALGIAVDDTLHFINWFRQTRACGASVDASIRDALERCAPAMLETTLISCAAMLPFFFSSFLPTCKFALLMISILTGAIIGDLILLPALILSRPGRVLFRRQHESKRIDP